MSSRGSIVVIGATGRQGGAVARHLLRNGWNVRALTRHAKGAAAQELARLGAEVVEGSLDSRESLRHAFQGAHGVFGVTDFWEHGYDGELRQGQAMIAVAKAVGIRHFIFNSVGGTDRTQGAGIAHFDAKRDIEEHLRNSGLASTIFRPVTFFENFVTPRFRRSICADGLLRFCILPDKPFQMGAMDDVGAFVAKAFDNPDDYVGKALELASDRFTLTEFATALGDAIGRNVRYQCMSTALQWAVATYVELTRATAHYKVGRSLIQQFKWNNSSPDGGWNANLAHLRQLHPALLRMREWIATVDWCADMDQSGAIVRK